MIETIWRLLENSQLSLKNHKVWFQVQSLVRVDSDARSRRCQGRGLGAGVGAGYSPLPTEPGGFMWQASQVHSGLSLYTLEKALTKWPAPFRWLCKTLGMVLITKMLALFKHWNSCFETGCQNGILAFSGPGFSFWKELSLMNKVCLEWCVAIN